MEIHFSRSEENGIKAVPSDALNIYSVGVSTAGAAEIRMANNYPNCKIIASTIDSKGAEIVNKYVNDQGYSDRIAVKIEDISARLPYPDNFFDYVYARLVLHYLSKTDLEKALADLHRVLKPGGKLYVVVRSTKAENFSESTATYDDATGFTTFLSKSDPNVKKHRYFHTPETISKYVKTAGFNIEYVTEYVEEIYSDFDRTVRPNDEPLIELLAAKP